MAPSIIVPSAYSLTEIPVPPRILCSMCHSLSRGDRRVSAPRPAPYARKKGNRLDNAGPPVSLLHSRSTVPLMTTPTAVLRPAEGLVSDRDANHTRRWWILAVLGIAQLMVILDNTIVNIALPTAQHALRFSNADRQWVVTGYSLAFGSLLLLGGRIGDIIGRKRALLIGLVGFAFASALGGASVNFVMLVCARTIQGAFGALLAPSVLALLTTPFTNPAERGKAFAIYGGIAGAGGALGLLLGGILTSYASWRWTLFVNLVFAAVAAVGALLWLKNDKAADRDPVDIPGLLLVTGGLFSLVSGLSPAQTTAWSNPFTIGFLVVGVI